MYIYICMCIEHSHVVKYGVITYLRTYKAALMRRKRRNMHVCGWYIYTYIYTRIYDISFITRGTILNCHERAQQARDNYNIVTRVIQLISPSQSCDNLFITYLCLYQALNRENTETRSGCVLH